MELFSRITTGEYYVIIFDVCSSSVILEKLQSQNRLNVWRKLWTHIHFILMNKLAHGDMKCIIYKFVGDGFIIMFRPKYADEIIPFCEKIKQIVDDGINEILRTYGSVNSRTGVTFGIERGPVIRMRLNGSVEYMGRAVNVAARLQSLLKMPDDADHMLVSDQVKNDIAAQIGMRTCILRNEPLHNLNDGKPFACWEIALS